MKMVQWVCSQFLLLLNFITNHFKINGKTCNKFVKLKLKKKLHDVLLLQIIN